MRRILLPALAAALVAAGAAGAAYRPSPLLPLDGAYRLADGTVLSLAVTPDGGLLYTNTRTGDLRQLSPPAAPGRFTFGPAYLVAGPVRGTITVKGPSLTLATGGRTRTARRIAVKRQAVSFAGQGVRLAGKVTSPATAGRHPAIAIVHGSEAGDRDYYDMLVNFYSSLGYVVLTYDKRGVGASKGVYQEFPSERNVDNLAGDAIGALRVLAARKDVDREPHRARRREPGRLDHPAGRRPVAARQVRRGHRGAGRSRSASRASTRGSPARARSNPTKAQIEEQLYERPAERVRPAARTSRSSRSRCSGCFGSEDKSVYAPQSVAILQALPSPPDDQGLPARGPLPARHAARPEQRAHRRAPVRLPARRSPPGCASTD